MINDTVGDPAEDTAHPPNNPLIKVMSLDPLLIASAIVTLSVGDDANTAIRIIKAVVAWYSSLRPSPCHSAAARRWKTVARRNYWEEVT
ncbi:hypothetical protein [Actinophytocola oryzae]|uniref:Uncharacterized protein n=1 Tax=Actinophytocola oryzae TaxID=502181 RepID=A0A4R7W0K1_9PSEU|nr:hypothetical protein [Actinophytocola oryzae]TDV56046.1 hypothetical protein CLV71_102107 [Actinophytocola oryzae]